MITVNDKLKLFRKRIVGKRQNAYDKKVHELEDKMVLELEERKELLDKDRHKYESSLLKGIKSERKQRLSNARSEKKRRLLLKRRTMIDTLLEGVRDYTKDFVQTPDYNKYLKKLIMTHLEEIQSLDGFKVYLCERDYAKQGLLQDIFYALDLECRGFDISERQLIGGLILVNLDQSIRLDLSLDSVIEDNKTYMGQLIYSLLEEAGGKRA
jgi:vacuolar-type H+-ATPase subunit E/Vma4